MPGVSEYVDGLLTPKGDLMFDSSTRRTCEYVSCTLFMVLTQSP